MSARYGEIGEIGLNYADLRRPDPRLAAVIDSALGSARAVLPEPS